MHKNRSLVILIFVPSINHFTLNGIQSRPQVIRIDMTGKVIVIKLKPYKVMAKHSKKKFSWLQGKFTRKLLDRILTLQIRS